VSLRVASLPSAFLNRTAYKTKQRKPFPGRGQNNNARRHSNILTPISNKTCFGFCFKNRLISKLLKLLNYYSTRMSTITRCTINLRAQKLVCLLFTLFTNYVTLQHCCQFFSSTGLPCLVRYKGVSPILLTSKLLYVLALFVIYNIVRLLIVTHSYFKTKISKIIILLRVTLTTSLLPTGKYHLFYARKYILIPNFSQGKFAPFVIYAF
jgi:hypothetical protein